MPNASAPLHGVMQSKGAYNKHAKLPAGGAALALPLLEKAVQSVKVDAEGLPIVIADYGSSQGKNSMAPMQLAIQGLRRRVGPNRAISVFHVDQPSNDCEELLVGRYTLAFLKADAAQMERFASAAMGKPGLEDSMLAAQAETQAWYGKMKNTRALMRRAMDSAEHNDAKETAANYQAEEALYEAGTGNREQARAAANAALKLAANREVEEATALVLARAGDTAAAEKLAAELDKTFPVDTLVQKYWVPTIRAAEAMEGKDPNQAVELLKETSAIELGSFEALVPVYVRGEAYLALNDGERAAVEFQKFIDYRGVVTNFPWGALARLGLARAYALQGDTAKARAAYKDFLALWKDADPDIPILKQAKAEYAKLQ